METRRLADLTPSRRRIQISGPARLRRFPWQGLLLWLVVLGLLYLALRQVALAEVGQVLSHLGWPQILALIAINAAVLGLMSARWSLSLRAFGYHLPFGTLLAYRLAGFGVTYLTPGPQVGGEPVQVHLLHSRQGVALTAAVSSVFLDRMVDLLANFTFLVIGTQVIVLSGVVRAGAGWAWAFSVGLLLLPLGHLLALLRGSRPAAWLMQQLWLRLRRPVLFRAAEIAALAEDQIALLLCEQPWIFIRVLGLAAFTWLVMIAEFWLALRFLGVSASLAQAICALTAARLAFLLPLPGGLGALEASQALATRLLGWGPEVGLALSLVIRSRDVFLAVLGILLGGYAYRSALFNRRRVNERS